MADTPPDTPAETIPDLSLQDNSSQRLPCVIVVDGSGSMEGAPIAGLNAGLQALEAELKEDRIARLRVRLLVLRLGGDNEVSVASDWTDAIDFKAPVIEASGNTPLGKAVRQALVEIQNQKAEFDKAGIPSLRPWMFILTDGAPTDPDWEQAAAECVAAENAKHVSVFAIGVDGADMSHLAKFSAREPKQLNSVKFKEFFVWLSRSTAGGSKSAIGEKTQLAPTSDWDAV
jgi:uncharacterized protein YegL